MLGNDNTQSCFSHFPSAYFTPAVWKHKQFHCKHSSVYKTWERKLTTCFWEHMRTLYNLLDIQICLFVQYSFFCRSECCFLFPYLEIGQENYQFEITVFCGFVYLFVCFSTISAKWWASDLPWLTNFYLYNLQHCWEPNPWIEFGWKRRFWVALQIIRF